MNEQEYREYCGSVRNDALDCADVQLLHSVIGIASEAGELLDILKKQFVYNIPADREHVVEELGDVLHYMMYLLIRFDCTIEELMLSNVAKLRQRYPDGFSNKDALERKDKL